MKINVGTSGFGHKEWKGKFYPDKIDPKEMLRYYAERLSTVEINNTFYHMPTEGLLKFWLEQVPDNFIFAFKAPQVITHLKQLQNVSEETDYLFRTLSTLGPKLGPVLFQFPRSFGVNRQALEAFLTLIPPDAHCAFEFRNKSWLDAEILDLLRKREFSLCIVDMDDSPANEIIHTAPWGYLRLRRSDYADADLSQWLKKISSQKWEEVFIFFKHEDEARGPELALSFRKLAESK